MGLEVSETQPGGLLHTLRAKCLHLHSVTLPNVLATCGQLHLHLSQISSSTASLLLSSFPP